jgi:hypothetical protein
MRILIVLSYFIITSYSALSADFTLQQGTSRTLTVEGCARGEVGVAELNPSIDGTHLLTSRCLPIFCAYTNETPSTLFGTAWTIKLLARDSSKDSKGLLKGEPQFDHRLDKILYQSIKSKAERDAIIHQLRQDGNCLGVYYDRNTPSV